MSFGDYGSGGGNRGGGGGGYERMGNGGGGGGGRYQSGGGDAFAECTQKITANTFTINSNVQALQKITSFLGTARDTGDMRARAKQMQDQTTMIIRDTSAELKRLGTINEGNARERRLQGDKLSKDLRAVITKWSSACQGYIGKERNTVGRQRAASGREGGGGGFGGGGGGGGGYDEKASLIEAEQRRKMEQMDQQVMSNDSLIQEREDAIKDIESQMLEVNDIFKDLSVAVQDQGHQLDSIEANMSQAYSSVDDGAQQLEKANRYQKKSRNKMCCFLLILIIVLAIVVVPLVLKNNKPAAPNTTLTWQNNF